MGLQVDVSKRACFPVFPNPFTVARDHNSVNKRHEQPRSVRDGAKRWRNRNATMEKAGLSVRG